MVDSIGSKTVPVQDRRIAPIAQATRAAPVGGRQEETVSTLRDLSALAFDFGTRPPVDTERVARIKKAIDSGHYPILPETVADRLLALKLEWSPKK